MKTLPPFDRTGVVAYFLPLNQTQAEWLCTNKIEYMARELTAKTKVTFALHAPEAEEVRLAGCFTGWEKDSLNLQKQKDGTWKKTVTLPRGTYEYRFVVDGQWQDDPTCAMHRPNAFGTQNCVRVV